MEMIRATMDEKKFSSHNFSNAAEIIFFIIFGLGCFVMEAKIDLVICRNQRQARKTAKKMEKSFSFHYQIHLSLLFHYSINTSDQILWRTE